MGSGVGKDGGPTPRLPDDSKGGAELAANTSLTGT